MSPVTHYREFEERLKYGHNFEDHVQEYMQSQELKCYKYGLDTFPKSAMNGWMEKSQRREGGSDLCGWGCVNRSQSQLFVQPANGYFNGNRCSFISCRYYTILCLNYVVSM